MERHAVERQQEDIRELATDLLRQAERLVMAELLEQAKALLAQVWTMTTGRDPDLANTVAWNLGWLLTRMGAYGEAAGWFSQVVAPPAHQSQLWPMARQSLVQICHMLAPAVPEPTAVSRILSTNQHPACPPAEPALPLLVVTTLGRFQLARAEKPLPSCKARKSIAIFRYLLTRRHHTAQKDELVELLWPDAPPREATHSLHVAVSTLRHYLDPSNRTYLLFEGGRYLINPDAPIEDDRATFQQLTDAAEQAWRDGDLERAQQIYTNAIGCYQGDYYVDDRDITWAVAERERLLARYLSALDHLGRIFMKQRCFESAVDCYRRLLERDSYREDAHSQIMRCYWRLGRRGEALRQYEQCAALLAKDLGLEPMPEIRILYQEIAGTSADS